MFKVQRVSISLVTELIRISILLSLSLPSRFQLISMNNTINKLGFLEVIEFTCLLRHFQLCCYFENRMKTLCFYSFVNHKIAITIINKQTIFILKRKRAKKRKKMTWIGLEQVEMGNVQTQIYLHFHLNKIGNFYFSYLLFVISIFEFIIY